MAVTKRLVKANGTRFVCGSASRHSSSPGCEKRVLTLYCISDFSSCDINAERDAIFRSNDNPADNDPRMDLPTADHVFVILERRFSRASSFFFYKRAALCHH